MTRTVLNGRAHPVVLTPENCTRDGWGWHDGVAWDDLDWAAAVYQRDSLLGVLRGAVDRHILVPHKDKITMNTRHRIRGKRWTITGLLPGKVER